eukprot:6482143-Amphidinium_carterae.3
MQLMLSACGVSGMVFVIGYRSTSGGECETCTEGMVCPGLGTVLIDYGYFSEVCGRIDCCACVRACVFSLVDEMTQSSVISESPCSHSNTSGDPYNSFHHLCCHL